MLQQGLALAGASIASTSLAAPSQSVARDERVLVVVQLVGGNDGLNTVIPARNDSYHRYRPTLAISRADGLPLDDEWSLHPALTGLKQLFDDGLVSIVQGVGYRNPSRSHFKSQDVWQSALPAGPHDTGWLGRYVDSLSGGDSSSRLAAGLTFDEPLALRGRRSRPAVLTEASGNLQAVARMIAADSPARAYYVSWPGYDTHVDQADRHARQLAAFGHSMAQFVDALRRSGHLDRALVMVFSEFGRSVAENAAGGTDHGEAGPMFLIGSQVNPGLHGQSPSLARRHLDRLPWTTDFRQVYGAILRDWFEADPARILGGVFTPLPVIR